MTTMVQQQTPGLRDAAQPNYEAMEAMLGAGRRTVSVCLFEEEQLFRAGCEYYLAASQHITLKLSDGFPGRQQTLELVLANRPDVLILGVTDLAQDVVSVIKDVQKLAQGTGVILSYTHASDAAIFALRDVSRQSGAGFALLPKHSVESASHLTQLIEAVAAGRVILDPKVMDQMFSVLGRQDSFLGRLSKRESEIIEMISQGMSNQDIADALFLERKTVERHINGIYGKLSSDDLTGHVRVKAVLAYLMASGRMAPAA